MMISRKTIILSSLSFVIILTGAGLGVYFGLFYESPSGTNNVILSITNETTTQNYTMADLMSLPSITGMGGYKKTTGTIVGPYSYKGVSLLSLLDEVGGIVAASEIIVEASDGYTISYSNTMISGQLTAYDNITGENLGVSEFDVIVAYEEDGNSLSSDDGPLRIAFLSDEGYLTDGSLWAKKVSTIEIATSTSWIVYLYGLTNDSISREVFESAMVCDEPHHYASYVIQDGDRFNTYEGVPLWLIVAIVDGKLADSTHFSFNDTLAESGYNVTLKNSDNVNIVLNSTFIAHNDDIILAAKKNSVFFSSSESPLRLVGSVLKEVEMIGRIIEIWLDF